MSASASSKNVIIPTPPHPNPMTCVAPTMCASARNMMLRSTDHVCKCKERYHPHPTPPQPQPHPMTCVAPTMCASARNMMLRSTDHVCKFKERYHPHPTPPQPHPNFIYINPLGAGVPGEPRAPRVYIHLDRKVKVILICISFFMIYMSIGFVSIRWTDRIKSYIWSDSANG